MTELSRRSFLRGLLTVAAVSIVPVVATIDPSIPRIVGDGVHDDTAGLQAALDGKPFICEDALVTNTKEIRLGVGTFRISSTLHVRDRVHIIGSGPKTRIVMTHADDATPMIYIHPRADLSGGALNLERTA